MQEQLDISNDRIDFLLKKLTYEDQETDNQGFEEITRGSDWRKQKIRLVERSKRNFEAYKESLKGKENADKKL